MEEAVATRYWCHLCSQMVNPIMEAEIKCPFCNSGFVEEMSSSSARDIQNPSANFDSDRALSLWAPILLGMMGETRRHRRLRRAHFDFDDDNDDGEAHHHGDESELDREFDSLIRRRRRSSAAILQLLQGIQSGMASEAANYEGDRERGSGRERERALLINPFNEAVVVQGSYDGHNQNRTPIGSLGDYFIGPGLDMLLQHLAENDPNRYGTPPAQKEAIEALKTVTIGEVFQCSVCLDDFEVGAEAKEMPCNHKFHSGCLLPWLELHSSCPVCRYELPSDQSKLDADTSSLVTSSQSERGSNSSLESRNSPASSGLGDTEEEAREGNGRRFSFPWPFNSLFSSSSSSTSGSQSGGNNSRNDSHTNEN